MADNSAPIINPWNTLSTVTKFDAGKNTNTTVCINMDRSQTRQVVNIVAPSVSLLIESLIQQLCTLFEDDTVRRNKLYFAICDRLHEMKLIDSSYNMMEFESLRGQYQHALYQLVRVARAATGCENLLQMPSSMTKEWSRYHKEFQEISFIASGGFGHVYKALHRLDGTEYAVKKIIVRSGQVKSILKHLEEVKTLARLNHTNIVSYKGAWIERTLPPIYTNIIPSLPSNYSQNNISLSNVKEEDSHKSCTQHDLGEKNQLNSSSSNNSQNPTDTGQRIINENIKGNVEGTTSNSISFRNDSKNVDDNGDKIENNSKYMDSSDSFEEFNSNNKLCPYIPELNEQCLTLYIQMALCEKTLQQWLNERNEHTSQTMIIGVLTQILCGLNYIHSRGIVHHDIKPSNIFISMSGNNIHIQLGDFGLACPLQRENHRSVLGTQMYAAPEQLEGKCDPKSDIYSLGIVLLELLIHTKTHMERVEMITSVKRGQIPTMLTATYPKWAHIVSQLVQVDPTKRPSTSQLLQDLNEDKDMTITQLKTEVVTKDNTIQVLQDRIAMLEAIITKHNIPIDDT